MSRATPKQQTARVDVDDAAWRRFRGLALETDRSIADYLGQLVRDELRRAKRRTHSGSVATTVASQETTEPAAAAPGTRREQPPRRVRLADTELLTGLPTPRADGAASDPPDATDGPRRRRRGR